MWYKIGLYCDFELTLPSFFLKFGNGLSIHEITKKKSIFSWNEWLSSASIALMQVFYGITCWLDANRIRKLCQPHDMAFWRRCSTKWIKWNWHRSKHSTWLHVHSLSCQSCVCQSSWNCAHTASNQCDWVIPNVPGKLINPLLKFYSINFLSHLALHFPSFLFLPDGKIYFLSWWNCWLICRKLWYKMKWKRDRNFVIHKLSICSQQIGPTLCSAVSVRCSCKCVQLLHSHPFSMQY